MRMKIKTIGKYDLRECPHCGKLAPVEFADLKTEEMCLHSTKGSKCPCYKDEIGCAGVFVVCNRFEGGCGASSGWGWDKETAVANWNRRNV